MDAGHQVPVYWYGKSKIASLFGSGPINGANSEQMLGWIKEVEAMNFMKNFLKN